MRRSANRFIILTVAGMLGWAPAAGAAGAAGFGAALADLGRRGDLITVQATPDRCVFRCRVLREECTADMKRQSQPEDGCWDAYGECRDACSGAAGAAPAQDGGGGGGPPRPTAGDPPADAPAGAAAAAFDGDPVVLPATPIPVGKWAEGVVFDGRSLWIAESGQRTVAEVDPAAGAVRRQVRVGRLPVGMVFGGGQIYAAVVTDRQIVRIDPASGQGRPIATLRECPQDIAFGAGAVWVLTWPDCSSAATRVVRVDPRSGAATPGPTIEAWGQAVAAQGGDVWIAQVNGGGLSVVSGRDLSVQSLDLADQASLWAITATRTGVYAGGRLGEDNKLGVVIAFDPRTRAEIARHVVDARIEAIVADDRFVVAVAENGRLFAFSASDLEPLQKSVLETDSLKATSAALIGDTLVVVAQQYQGENGAAFLVEGWHPGASAAGAAPPVGGAAPAGRPKPPRPDAGSAPQAGGAPQAGTRPQGGLFAEPPVPQRPRPQQGPAPTEGLFGAPPGPDGGGPSRPGGRPTPTEGLFAAPGPVPAPPGPGPAIGPGGPGPGPRPIGIDCRRISGPAEAAVCADPRLIAFDREIARGVQLRLTNIVSGAEGGTPADQRKFLREHARWQAERDQCGPDPRCLRQAYRARQRYMEEVNQAE